MITTIDTHMFDPGDERWQERGKSSRMHDMCR